LNELPGEVLGRRWVHAHEEDTDDEMVFRPAEYPLPPSRGRQRLEFKPDGTFFESVPGPTDAPEGRAGSWKVEDGKLVIESDQAPEGTRTLEIASVDEDRLVVKKPSP
jgi:hypothetical protein